MNTSGKVKMKFDAGCQIVRAIQSSISCDFSVSFKQMQLAGILTAQKLGNIGNCKGIGRNWVLRSLSVAMEFGLETCLLFESWPQDLMMITLNAAAGCIVIVRVLSQF